MLIINIYFLLIIISKLNISQRENIYYYMKYRLNNENYILNDSSRIILNNPIIISKFKAKFFQTVKINRKLYQNNTAHILNENRVNIKLEMNQNINNLINSKIYITNEYIEDIKFFSFSYIKYYEKLFKNNNFCYLNYIEKFSKYINEDKYIYKETYENNYYRNEKIYNNECSFSSKRIINANKKIYINKFDKNSENKYSSIINNNIHHTNICFTSIKTIRDIKK